LVARERRLAALVAVRRSRGDRRRVERLPGGGEMIPGDPRARQEGLDASGPPAVAGGARPLVAARPGQGGVSPLAGNRVRAGEDATVDGDPPARAGSQDDAEDDTSPRARPVARLGEGEAVRVVREPEGTVQQALEVLAERAAVEPDTVGVLDHPGGGRE